jgi:hypothetical protein
MPALPCARLTLACFCFPPAEDLVGGKVALVVNGAWGKEALHGPAL